MDEATLVRTPASELAGVACQLAADVGRWSPFVRDLPGQRHYEELAYRDLHAWVITWPPGTGLALHDHADADGALVVVRGSLFERYTTQGRGTFRTRTLVPGRPWTFDADHVHEVWNTGDAAAVSIHVYSAPVAGMRFYAADTIMAT